MGGRGDVLVVKQDSAALESGDADVRLPRELAESRLIAADNPFLKFAGFERLDAADGRPRSRRQTVQTIQTEIRLLREHLLLHLKILVLVELLLRHDVDWLLLLLVVKLLRRKRRLQLVVWHGRGRERTTRSLIIGFHQILLLLRW